MPPILVAGIQFPTQARPASFAKAVRLLCSILDIIGTDAVLDARTPGLADWYHHGFTTVTGRSMCRPAPALKAETTHAFPSEFGKSRTSVLDGGHSAARPPPRSRGSRPSPSAPGASS